MLLFPTPVQGTPLPTGIPIRPYGQTTVFAGRPVALASSAQGRVLFAKDDRGLTVIDGGTGKVRQRLASAEGTSLTGLAVAPNGHVLLTDARSSLRIATQAGGVYAWQTPILLPTPKAGGTAYPCGIAFAGPNRAWICLSRGNEIVEVDLSGRKVLRRIATSPAPYALAIRKGRAYVSCWGRTPKSKGAPASGTPVEVDARGVATGGSLDIVDLALGRVLARKPVGLQPSEIVALPDGRIVVACANDDSLAVLAANGRMSRVPLKVRADDPFGSAPGALALSPDRRTLFVALGGSNAVAKLDARTLRVEGFVPAGWYPTALAFVGSRLGVANAKGDGRPTITPTKGTNARTQRGSVDLYTPPAGPALASTTATVKRLTALPREIPATSSARPVPVPKRLGDPSVFRHIVYVIKENRTYDQLFGDIARGNGDPSLCLYGSDVTPNHHALADEFLLLDNFYCNGIISSDGHAWSIEGNATGYLERAFGGWTRSYPFGDDPLSASRTGYLWDHVLAGGRSFRNHGEFDYATPNPKANFTSILADFTRGERKIGYTQNIGVERLRRYSSDVPGWNMGIPDVVRADRFLRSLKESERSGVFPNVSIVYLPQDHTSGLTPGAPTPRAHLADNDLALGRVVEGLSRSKFWPETCVFVVEDDPQDGFDHVDGRRSIGLVLSPYSRRKGAVVSSFYNQTSVLRTMFRMLGLPPRTIHEAASPLMTACFGLTPDLTPYKARPNAVPLDELNPPANTRSAFLRPYAEERLPLERPDSGSDDLMNRILWHAAKGNRRYPAEMVGARTQPMNRPLGR